MREADTSDILEETAGDGEAVVYGDGGAARCCCRHPGQVPITHGHEQSGAKLGRSGPPRPHLPQGLINNTV